MDEMVLETVPLYEVPAGVSGVTELTGMIKCGASKLYGSSAGHAGLCAGGACGGSQVCAGGAGGGATQVEGLGAGGGGSRVVAGGAGGAAYVDGCGEGTSQVETGGAAGGEGTALEVVQGAVMVEVVVYSARHSSAFNQIEVQVGSLGSG